MSAMDESELLSLPLTVDIETAGRAIGIGRSKSYQLAAAGDFPVRVLQVGRRYRVVRADLLELLGIAPPKREAAPRQGNGSHASAPTTGTHKYEVQYATEQPAA
jgi:hypothetical protein